MVGPTPTHVKSTHPQQTLSSKLDMASQIGYGPGPRHFQRETMLQFPPGLPQPPGPANKHLQAWALPLKKGFPWVSLRFCLDSICNKPQENRTQPPKPGGDTGGTWEPNLSAGVAASAAACAPSKAKKYIKSWDPAAGCGSKNRYQTGTRGQKKMGSCRWVWVW